MEKQILIIFAGTNGLPGRPAGGAVPRVRRGAVPVRGERAPAGCCSEIREKKALDDALRAEIHALLKEFKERFVAERKS